MPVYSGLSALIQAATSQLGHLIDNSDASELSHHSPYHNGDGYASSSDGDTHGRSSTPTWTPTIVPEGSHNENRRSIFPELLMTVLVAPENADISTFLPDGKFFAIRVKEFSDDLLHRHFHLTTFQEFLDELNSWGFSVISSEEETDGSASNVSEGSIQVFRHPHFRKGATVDLRHVRFSACGNLDPGSTSGNGNGSSVGVPGRARIEYTMSDDSSTSAKRRLSPSHVQRDSEVNSSKLRAVEDADYEYDHVSVASSHHSADTSSRAARRRSSTEIRSKALAVTAAQLSLDDGHPHIRETRTSKAERRASLPLADGGLDKATQTIVTDAIETLLFDERHTREMYLKHEKELSKSSLPGVIPISKQLFSPPSSDAPPRAQQVAAATRALMQPAEISSMNYQNAPHPGSVSPSQLEAAAALVKQAGMKGKFKVAPLID